MRVHWLQHAEHERLGSIEPWLAARGLRVRATALHAGEPLPGPDDFDWLIVMGGPMNVYEHDRHPWLIPEKKLIRDACVRNKKVLGVCLGAQLLADVTGGKVRQNNCQEIGWFDVEMTDDGGRSRFLEGLPRRFTAFHWHGDTFTVPAGAANLLKSDACVNQAFEGPGRLGLQFHLEITLEDARRWLALEEPPPDRYVQGAAEILRDPARFDENNRLLSRILERFL